MVLVNWDWVCGDPYNWRRDDDDEDKEDSDDEEYQEEMQEHEQHVDPVVAVGLAVVLVTKRLERAAAQQEAG